MQKVVGSLSLQIIKFSPTTRNLSSAVCQRNSKRFAELGYCFCGFRLIPITGDYRRFARYWSPNGPPSLA
jgi:hypothetical protein